MQECLIGENTQGIGVSFFKLLFRTFPRDVIKVLEYLFSKCCLELSHMLSRDVRVLLKVLKCCLASLICIALGVVFVQQLMCDIEDETSLANTFST